MQRNANGFSVKDPQTTLKVQLKSKGHFHIPTKKIQSVREIFKTLVKSIIEVL